MKFFFVYLIEFSVDCSEGIRSLHEESVELVIVVGMGIGVSPRNKDQLAVAVDWIVEDNILLGQQEISHIHIFNFGEGRRSMVGITTLVVGSPSFVEVESPVSVSIYSLEKHLKYKVLNNPNKNN